MTEESEENYRKLYEATMVRLAGLEAKLSKELDDRFAKVIAKLQEAEGGNAGALISRIQEEHPDASIHELNNSQWIFNGTIIQQYFNKVIIVTGIEIELTDQQRKDMSTMGLKASGNYHSDQKEYAITIYPDDWRPTSRNRYRAEMQFPLRFENPPGRTSSMSITWEFSSPIGDIWTKLIGYNIEYA